MQREPMQTARRWLAQATSEFEAAQANAADGRAYLACFLSQQSAEKAIKAALHWAAGDAPRTHLIRDLLDELRATEPDLAAALEGAASLEQYYQSTRYPDVLDMAVPAQHFDSDDARLALGRAETVLAAVKAYLDVRA